MNFVKKHQLSLGFICLLFALFFFLNFDSYFFLRPQGVHFVRQTDGLSFVSNYFRSNLHFFDIKLFNLKNGVDGRGVCEFPVLYYCTALLYFVFGEKEFILKLLHLLFFFLGVFHIHRLCLLLLKDVVYSIFIPLFLFSSVSLVYYSFNFLPDSPALGFAFSGLYFLFKYRVSKQRRHLRYCTLFLTFSSLLKATYLINPIGALGLFLMEFWFLNKNGKKSKVNIRSIIYHFGICLFVVLAWNLFVIKYNAYYESTYFTTSALPIWKLIASERAITWQHIIGEWPKKYLAHSSMHLLGVFFILVVVTVRKIERSLFLFCLLLLLGNTAYFLLFFIQFKHHDYYCLTFFPLVVLFLILGVQSIQRIFKSNVIHLVIKSGVIIIVLTGMNYARMKVEERYSAGNDHFSQIGFILNEHSAELKSLPISPHSKVVLGPDYSINGGLYFIQKQGWIFQDKMEITTAELKRFYQKGARYLLVIQLDNQCVKGLDKMAKRILVKQDLVVYKL
jgi:hypothetical protein